MVNIIAILTIFLLIIISYEKNFLKYGIIIGIVWTVFQALNLEGVAYVGLISTIVMVIGYSIIAIVVGLFVRNMSSRMGYSIAYMLCYDIAAYFFYRFIVINCLLMFS